MWQAVHASFLPGDIFLSKSISSPSVSIDSVPVSLRTGGFGPGRTGSRVGSGRARHLSIALPSMTSISRKTLAVSESKSGGRMPDGYGSYRAADGVATGFFADVGRGLTNSVATRIAQIADSGINLIRFMTAPPRNSLDETLRRFSAD